MSSSSSSSSIIDYYFINNESKFDSLLSEIEGKKDTSTPIFALFLSKGQENITNNIKELLISLNKKAIFIEVVVDADSFSSPSSFYRTHTIIIKSLPSLIAIRRGRSQGTINDFSQSSLINDFLLTIINRTAVAAAVAASNNDNNNHNNNIVIHEEILQESLFDDRMKEIEEQYQGKPIFIMVIGDRDACSLQSWCPDCVVADPIVISALNKIYEKSGAILVEAPVQRSTYKGNPSHPYRIHSQLKITAVPTLYKWKCGKSYGSLIEGELFDAKNVEKFVAETF